MSHRPPHAGNNVTASSTPSWTVVTGALAALLLAPLVARRPLDQREESPGTGDAARAVRIALRSKKDVTVVETLAALKMAY